MKTALGIDVAAPPEVVFALARDVTRWARLLPHYDRSRLVRFEPDGSVVVAFVARRPIVGLLGLGLPVTWRSRCWAEPASAATDPPTERAWRLRFVHVAGVTRGMDVTWHIRPTSSGCSVTIEHDFRPRLSGLARFVDRWFTRAIAGRTLATFRDLAEAVAWVDTPGGPPDRADRTDRST